MNHRDGIPFACGCVAAIPDPDTTLHDLRTTHAVYGSPEVPGNTDHSSEMPGKEDMSPAINGYRSPAAGAVSSRNLDLTGGACSMPRCPDVHLMRRHTDPKGAYAACRSFGTPRLYALKK
jgi:hypothetical protein